MRIGVCLRLGDRRSFGVSTDSRVFTAVAQCIDRALRARVSMLKYDLAESHQDAPRSEVCGRKCPLLSCAHISQSPGIAIAAHRRLLVRFDQISLAGAYI